MRIITHKLIHFQLICEINLYWNLPLFVLWIKQVSKWLFPGGNSNLVISVLYIAIEVSVFIVCFRWKGPIQFNPGRNQSCPADHTSEEHCLEKYFSWCCFTQHYWCGSWRSIQSIGRTNANSTEKWINHAVFQKFGHSSFASLKTNFRSKCCSLYVWCHVKLWN